MTDENPLSTADPRATREWYSRIRAEMAKVILGQSEVVEQLLLTVLCREHALLEGPAGTAKWSAVRALGRCLGLDVRRIRCSADLDLDDLLGCGAGTDPWRSQLLFVDNIDSLPAKLRGMAQQAMCERIVEARQDRQAVPDPFVIFATRFREHDDSSAEQNDRNDDRFLFQIDVPYPTYREEYSLAAAKSGPVVESAAQVVSQDQLDAWRELIPRIEAPPSVVHYAVRLVRATRVHEGENPDFVYEWVSQGAGPRAAHYLVLAAKARATCLGRATALHDDVRVACPPVLRHRIRTNQNARSNGIGPDQVIRRLLAEVPPCIVGDNSTPQSGAKFTFHDWIPDDDRGS